MAIPIQHPQIFRAVRPGLWNCGVLDTFSKGETSMRDDGADPAPRDGEMTAPRPADRRPDIRRPDPSLDEARLRQQAIGVKLRQMFDAVVKEPVPDAFLDLLERADARTEGGQALGAAPPGAHDGGGD